VERTVIELDPEDHAWLDRRAREEEVTPAELVRRLVREVREEEERKRRFEQALERSRGTWTEGDGLEYQIRLRAEWDRE